MGDENIQVKRMSLNLTFPFSIEEILKHVARVLR